MEFLVAILVLALAAAVVVAILQRRQPGARPLAGPRSSPLRRPGRGAARAHPLDAAVADHARATDPADVVVAERRLRAEARQVAAGMNGAAVAGGQHGPAGGNGRFAAPPANGSAGYAYDDPALSAASADPSLHDHFDPVTGEELDGYDPNNDPRYEDSRYDGRLAADWVDPRDDPRAR